MENVVLVIHLFLALAIIGLVLLQRSEGGGLGIGRSGGMGGFASARGAANALTKATAICAIAFFCTSILLGIMAGTHHGERRGILEGMEQQAPAVQTEAVETEQEDAGTTPAPSAPIAE